MAALGLIEIEAQTQEARTHNWYRPAEYVATPCSTKLSRVRGLKVDCGYVEVPEDRSKPGNTVRLAVVRLRGPVPAPNQDPVIYLHGGPGYSAIATIQGFIDRGRAIWEQRDMVIFDQRGVGHSRPWLECPEHRRHLADTRRLDLEPDEALQRYVTALLACRRRHSEQGIDLSTYTPATIAADVADLAAAMGYRRFNLFGASYGSRLALTVMRDFPANIRSVILDGVLPLQVSLTETRYADSAAALERFFSNCRADSRCAARYPNLAERFWNLVDHHMQHPLTRAYSDHYTEYDEDTGNESMIQYDFDERVDGYYFAALTLWWLRDSHAIPYLPFVLDQIATGNDAAADAFLRPNSRIPRVTPQHAALVAAWCSSEGAFIDPSVVAADRAAHPRLADPDATRDWALELCPLWQDSPTDAIENLAVARAIPTLLLSGEFDPTTPPRWAAMAAETLSHSYSFVVPMGGHGVGFATRCGRDLVARFLETPDEDPAAA